MALQPWYKIATPRADLREGRPLDASEFAIHLDQVVDGRAPSDYHEPSSFFKRTYITEGLLELSVEVLRRLSGETLGASPVINLTTPFGGGKTHALTLLYHLAKAGDKAKSWPGVKGILAKAQIPAVPKAAVAVFVGTQFDVLSGCGGPGEPTRKTPWGEIAWQLGGKTTFEVVEEHDTKNVAPSGEVIRKILPKDKPVLILMDEVLNFMNRARVIKVGASNLASQFYSFLQNLATEASGRTKVCLVLSLPMSEQEMTQEDQADFGRLTKLATRVDKAYILAKDLEVAEIIRRRLFENVGTEKDIKATSKACSDWMLAHREQLPSWFPIDHARERFEASYPFHPTVLSVFERKWQSLSKFQCTRAVLRMLALWVSRVYRDGFAGAHKDPLITLGSAPLDDSLFRAAVLEQLDEPRLDAAVKADIAGEEANAIRLDSESTDTIRAARLHQKVASTIFFESSGGQVREEATQPEIRLAVGEPGLDIGNVETTLEALSNTCYYLTVERNRYRFSIAPNIIKLLADRRASIPEENIDACVQEAIQGVFSKGLGAERVFFPEKSNQIPDRAALTLVILSPEHSWDDVSRADTQSIIDTLTREHGASARTFKSSLLWAVADEPTAMREEARNLLACKILNEEVDQLRLEESQRRHLTEQLKRYERGLREAVWRSYRNILLLGKDNTWRRVDLGLIHSSSAESMVALITTRLKQEGDLEDSIGSSFLARNWPPALTEWSTRSVRDTFFSSPQFPRLSNPENLRHTIAEGVSKGLFGYAVKSPDGTYVELRFNEKLSEDEVEFSDDIMLLPKQTAQAIKSGALPPEPVTVVGPTPEPVVTGLRAGVGVAPVAEIAKLTWEGEVPSQKWMSFYTKIISRFATREGLKLRVKAEVEPKEGISQQEVEETKTGLKELGLPDKIETKKIEAKKKKPSRRSAKTR